MALSPAVAAREQPSANALDSRIVDAIETRLLSDRATPSFLVDEVAVNGVMALAGTVENILAKERALEIAGSIEGVRAIVNRIVVAPWVHPDGDIRRDLFNAYAPAFQTEPSC